MVLDRPSRPKTGEPTMTTRPACVIDEHLRFLDGLRESGACNMFGAGKHIVEMFDVDRSDAKKIVLYWMETFGTDDR